ncbi:uncharacterized protein LOC110694850 [Chenopodium quinoa]|uniref:uncharacterized protein LOC110694850 n=1 Tax=Chenopodium quinoa TaxID=63459 RepID=UPI000B795FD5|nr:uncharacterized protein LOC110694850 [Chenopodium quinoa]
MPTDDANLEKENSEVVEKALDDVPTSKDGKAKANYAEKEKKKGFEPPPAEPKLPFPHWMQKNKLDQQFGKFLTMVKNLEVTVPFTDLVSQVPMYAKFLKEVITKKKDIGGVETVALTAECSTILQNKSPPKLKDPGSFSIPCHVGALFIDKALCDLGASVSVMPHSVCNRLNMRALKCTQITLQMADRSIKYPLVILEDVPVRVGKFFIPDDFVVLDMEVDSNIPIILGRPFLCTVGVVILVKFGSFTLSVGDDTVTFNLINAMKSPMLKNTCCRIDLLDEIVRDDMPRELANDPLEAILALEVSKGEGDAAIDSLIRDLDAPNTEGFEVMKTICSTSESQVKKVELKPLPSHLKYAFLDDNEECPVIVSAKLDDSQVSKLLTVLRMHKKAIGYSIDDLTLISLNFCFFQIPIHLEDQEKTTFTCPYGTFSYRIMPFGLCNAPTTFQRCMMAIFSDFIENIMEVFMDDFSVYGFDFDMFLHNLSKVLKRCTDVNLVLKWEKCHFIVNEGVALGHLISDRGIEVDKEKIEVIEKLLPPVNVKGVRSFLGHVGFYRRFIKYFSKIAKPLTQLFLKDATFEFTDACMKSFNRIKEALITAPIIQPPDWDLPFEIMCDASDYVVGVVLGQQKNKVLHAINYASKTLDEAQMNYATTEKELLAIVYALEKFRTYLTGGSHPLDLTYQQRKKFYHDAKRYFWDDPHLYQKCADGMFRRCVADWDSHGILHHCHNLPSSGHLGSTITAYRVLQCGFY